MHRTNESRNNSNIQDWSYHRTELNVVDDCSRCVKFKDLSNNCQWITQPSFLYQQTIEIEQDPVTGVRSIPIVDSPINVKLHQPSEDTGLSKRQLSDMQIANLIFNWEHYFSCEKLVRHVAK